MARSSASLEHQHNPQPQQSEHRLERIRRHTGLEANHQVDQALLRRLELEIDTQGQLNFSLQQQQRNSIAGPESPESLRSGGPYGYANSLTTSLVTTTTTELEQQRQISPVAGTPTSSNSSIVYAYNRSSASFTKYPEPSRVVGNSHRSRTSSRRAISPVAAAGVLAGIDAEQSLPPTNHFLQQHIECADRFGPYPGRPQQFPHSGQTWTGGYPFRHEDPMIVDSEPVSPETSQSLRLSSSSLSPLGSNERVGGRRTQPLTSEQRRNANQVRQLGACLRCQYMKETCDESTPCHNCQNKKKRKWRCGCRRLPLHRYIEYILPAILAEKLKWPNCSGYIQKQMMWYGNTSPPFPLWMSNGLGMDQDDIKGKCLIVMVREIEPTPHQTDSEQRAYLSSSSHGEAQIKSIDLTNPPVAPCLTDRQLSIQKEKHMQQLRSIAGRTVEDKESHWPWDCFQRKEEEWLGHVLDMIHEYYQQSLETHQPLRTALYLPFFNYMLSHPFEVPKSKVPELYQRLRQTEAHGILPDGPVCPSTVNRYLKSVVFTLTEKAMEKTLKHLNKLLRDMATNKDKTPATADMVFCLAFIVLYFLGQTQHSVFLQALNDQSKTETPFSMSEAWQQIHKMETELGDYIIYLCAYTFSRRSGPSRSSNKLPGRDDDYAHRFKLMDKMKDITRDNAHCTPSSLELSELDRNRFEIENPTRLCWKFFKAISDIS